jgi:methionyl-tRNA synthetase
MKTLYHMPISIDDFKKVEIKAGKILSAEPIEGSEKLLKLSVDFAEESPRQVLSGIAKYVRPEDLVGIICAFVTNLEPREIMGLQSQAMIMAVSGNSSDEEFFSLLKLSENTPPGSSVK